MKIPGIMFCRCKRCGHEWVRRIPRKPVKCAKCKTPYWDTKPGELPMGRPPKAKEKK